MPTALGSQGKYHMVLWEAKCKLYSSRLIQGREFIACTSLEECKALLFFFPFKKYIVKKDGSGNRPAERMSYVTGCSRHYPWACRRCP